MMIFDRPESMLLARVGLGLVFLCVLSVSPAWAQVRGDADRSAPARYERQERPSAPSRRPSTSSGSVTSLPEWAEPAEPTRGGPKVQAKSGPPCPGGNCGGGDDPSRSEVPLGGLEWLFAAGAGYGLWKLRDDE